VRLVRQGPGSDDARLPRMRCCSAHAETVSCGGWRSMAPARRRTCSRVRLSLAADAGRVEAIGSLRQKLIDVLLQDGLQQMGFDAEFGSQPCNLHLVGIHRLDLGLFETTDGIQPFIEPISCSAGPLNTTEIVTAPPDPGGAAQKTGTVFGLPSPHEETFACEKQPPLVLLEAVC